MTSGYAQRFAGVARLFGQAGLKRLRQAHVCVIGIGGVGSWAVEGLARSGVGHLTLVDLDDICVSNVNRQLHALTSELGKPKVEVMARRVLEINPECQVYPVARFFTTANAAEILDRSYAYVVDAIDSPSKKTLLIAACRERGLPVITTGAAAGKPAANVRIVDLAFASHDRLLQQARKQLRHRYGFPRGNQPFEVPCVCSLEPSVYPLADGTTCERPAQESDLRIDCDSGLGTASFVTGIFGLAAAGHVVAHIAKGSGAVVGPSPDQAAL